MVTIKTITVTLIHSIVSLGLFPIHPRVTWWKLEEGIYFDKFLFFKFCLFIYLFSVSCLTSFTNYVYCLFYWSSEWCFPESIWVTFHSFILFIRYVSLFTFTLLISPFMFICISLLVEMILSFSTLYFSIKRKQSD